MREADQLLDMWQDIWISCQFESTLNNSREKDNSEFICPKYNNEQEQAACVIVRFEIARKKTCTQNTIFAPNVIRYSQKIDSYREWTTY